MRSALVAGLAVFGGALLVALWGAGPPISPIHFAYRPIDFALDSCETLRRHAPETMAGGVAVFDYNNDGHLDIFFTNGADIETLKKTGKNYSNRLFENDGRGNFKDVTEKAHLAGTGYDNGVAVGDYDNDGYKDLFVGGVHAQPPVSQQRRRHLHRCDGQSGAGPAAGQGVRPSMVGRRRVGGRQ